MFQQSLIASYSYPIKQQALESLVTEFLLNGLVERIFSSWDPKGSWRLNLDVSVLKKLLHIQNGFCAGL